MRSVVRFAIYLTVAAKLCSADEITDWNLVMLRATLTAPATPAPVTTRVAAIVQAAVFDAVNGINPRYTSLHVPPAAPAGASERAAAVQAAYATLVSLYPDQKAKFDQQRSTSLAAITDSSDAVEKGLAWGQTVADQILAWRSRDGFSDTLAPYMGGTQPGQWRPTPPALAAGLVPQLGTTTPWVMRSASQFRPAGPADLNSDQYTADYNEVKVIGSSKNSGRTADQTLIANFWQVGNPPDYFDQLATSLAQENHFTMLQTARLLALVDVGMADALIGCWDAKYEFSSWRPITAIQLADTDGNDATSPDPTWTSLIVAPPFPEYPSAHSCATGAATRILSHYFGEQTRFNIVSLAMPGVTRTFHNFTAAADEVKNARVLGGIHFRTATVDGQALGISVGEYVLGHAMLATHGNGRGGTRE